MHTNQAIPAVTVLALLGALVPVRGAIDKANFDSHVKPQDDLYHYANGTWLKTHPIPPEYGAWGAFYEVDLHNQEALHTILERVAAAAANPNRSSPPAAIEERVGNFYASGMDEAAANAAGLSPLQPELNRLAAIRTREDIQSAIHRLHRIGVDVGFSFSSEQDPKNSIMMIGGAGQAGLGMPDRDYYTRTDVKSVKLREQYEAHMAKLLALAGDSPDVARGEARAIMKLETALAQGSKTASDLRDPVANYHKTLLPDLSKATPRFDWLRYFEGIGMATPDFVDVGQPEFLAAFDRQMSEAPVEDWRAYFRWHLLHSFAPYLSAAFVDENFAFFGRALTGTPKLRERWKRVLGTVDGSIGEDLGRLYVAEYFPPEAKERMLKLVGNLRSTLRTRLETLEWMDAPTRAKALAKLDAFGVKIGYPDKWIDYSALQIERGSYAGNVLRARAFNVDRDLRKIGKPVDRSLWGLTPPTVNAYYNPNLNEIVFPAGILQPPFFDAKADDAVNYGGIGAVIGHEMTHGFDDQGRQYDPQGNLTDWWTPESAKRFKERSTAIVGQFNGYIAIDDLHVNGELTQGENIADLGGVKIAYRALQTALAGQSREIIQGFTPEQRFFLSWATVWRENQRPESLRLQVNTDPHSPPQFRVDGPLSNLPEFAEAFHVPPGAPMRRPAAGRVDIW